MRSVNKSCSQHPQTGAFIRFWLAVVCCTVAAVGLIESSRILPLLLPSASPSCTDCDNSMTVEKKKATVPSEPGDGKGVVAIGDLGNDDDSVDFTTDEDEDVDEDS